MDSNTSVCIDIPGCRKDRGRGAADLGPDAPMLCSDAAPADKDADAVADHRILRTHVEMILCLRQCDRRPRRLARCHLASRRWWSCWRRSCHHCPRHHRRHHQHHHRSRPARCRQLPSTSAGVTARCSGGSCASCTLLSVAMALPPPAAPLHCRWGTGEVALYWCLTSSENLRWPIVLQQQGQYCVLCMHRRKCWTC